MTAKSKRNRPGVSRSRNTGTTSRETVRPINPNTLKQTPDEVMPINTVPKNTVSAVSDLSLIGHEIKWIGIVTGIIIILLAVAYFIFR